VVQVEAAAARIRGRTLASPHLVALAGLTLLGAVLRFATIDLQSYRYDEAVTVVRIIHPSLFSTMAAVPRSESTPPFYYLLAWLWSRLFGTGEVGLRSLSALAGTASIPIICFCARALLMRWRVGLIAAAIVAVSPVLIWFSQDARAYSLAFLLTALSFLFFARALREPSRANLGGWALSSALALCSHYFTGFVVAPEAVLLLLWTRERLRLGLAIGVVLAAGALLLPIGLQQAENAHASWIAGQPLPERLERAGAKLVGDDNGDEHGVRQPGPIPLIVPAGLALAALLMLVCLGDGRERRHAAIAGAVGAAGLVAPLALGVFGADYFDGRNMLPVFIPFYLVLAAGLGVKRAPRAGVLVAAAFCFCSLVFTIEIDRLPRLQREDLRNAAAQVGPPRPGVAIVTIRYGTSQPLLYYLGTEVADRPLPPLREIDLVGSKLAANANARRLLPPQFVRVESRPVSYNFTLTRYRSRAPVTVPLRLLENGKLVGGGARASVLTWPSASAERAAGH
jgi:4-amino-4-deoxy-L-arabinose transferase-like glycosyltransferase